MTADLAAPRSFLDGRVVLHPGDCLAVLKRQPSNSVDSVVTDPPYALVSIVKRFGKDGAAPAQAKPGGGAYARASAGFMGESWDTGKTAFAVEFWAEVLRVLKPGGHVVAFSGTRTYHRLVCAIEDAGFEIRDQLAWIYGSGFPKSHDVAKGIDKLDAAGARRDRALRFTAWVRAAGLTAARINALTGTLMGSHYTTAKEQPSVATREHLEILRPHVGEVPAWVEDLADQRTVESENFKAREVTGQHESQAQAARWREDYEGSTAAPAGAITEAFTAEAQRWDGWGSALKPAWEPICLARKALSGTIAANVLAHGTGALNVGASRIETDDIIHAPQSDPSNRAGTVGIALQASGGADRNKAAQRASVERTMALGRWPANILHDGSGDVLASFPGEAWRYFYSAKADSDDRIGSGHPTVKPVDLMQWLCRLITPPGGLVLDPFAGSGTTGEAAFREGMRALLCEREPDYQADIARRMDLALAGPSIRKAASGREKAKRKPPADLGLFGEPAA